MRSLLWTLCLLSAGLAGCTHVKPYERGKLAQRTMTEDVSGPALEHVYSVQEGATGGGAAAGSGCGCN